jgi:glutamate formiminotransferase/formiminotetrahydrofolate cyclodeaminase
MKTARLAVRLLASLPELVEKGNPNAASDVGSAALLLEAAAEAALLNVGINLSGATDAEFVGRMQRETADLQTEAQRLRDQVLAAVRRRF